jgi:osomolarity two-component system sensor histidine kinase NIK1
MEKLHHLRIELQLLKDQVQDVTRGDLEDHVLVQSVVIMMVHLKNVINTIVDKSGQFAKEVTQVSQVGIEG